MSDFEREAQLNRWAAAALSRQNVVLPSSFSLTRVSDDASFRRYFRAVVGEESWIFVDAPPAREDSEPFVQVAARMGAAGLNVPRVVEADLGAGFMMLSDLGNDLYLDHLADGENGSIDRLYTDAIRSLVRIQGLPADDLARYDETLLREEMNLFADWFLAGHLNMTLEQADRDLLAQVYGLLVDNALGQPGVFVHRDYHSRNLMVTPHRNPGILDFQDAVCGPLSYDLVSLLKDCYVRFPRSRINRWLDEYKDLAVRENLPSSSVSSTAFRRWFDLMGLQRHLKCAGIFSRLYYRDAKARYLSDIPMVVDYIREVCGEYEELAAFGTWVDERVVPLLQNKR